MSLYSLVRLMRAKFKLPIPLEPDHDLAMDDDWMDFRQALLAEEVEEVRVAGNAGDLAELLDGLVDTCVIAMGTAAALGLDFNAAFEEVMRSNMSKHRSTNNGEDTKRKNALDLAKGEDWVAPNMEQFTYDDAKPIHVSAIEKAYMIRKKKEGDYQRSTITKADYFPFGMVSHVQMLNLKVVRLRSLVSDSKTPNNESMEDTLLDLINYACFAYDHIQEDKE